MKNFIRLLPLFIGILLLGCAGSYELTSIAQDSKYSKRAFKNAVSATSAKDSILVLCRDFADNANNIDVVRDAQDKWMTVDKRGARDHFYNLYQEFPDSAKYVYLYGRLLSCRAERVKIGRKAVDLNPDWPYGYRLVLHCYYTHLFLDNDDLEVRDKLKATFARDSELFHRFDEMYVDRWFNGKMMFYYYMYTKDELAAKQELEKAFEWSWKWADEAAEYLQTQSAPGQN